MPSQFVVENLQNIYDVYKFEKKLGEGNFSFITKGSFGVVYKATHKVTKNVRAIKKIAKGKNTREVESSLMQEIAILKSLVNLLLNY